MPSKKLITFNSFLGDTYYGSRDIGAKEVVQLLRQAQAIPLQLLPFKGCIHVIDYTQRRHVGLTGPAKNMIGYDPHDVLDNDLDFIIDIFHKDDFKIYNEIIFAKTAEFLKGTPQPEHTEYVFSFTYRMRKPDGKWIHIFQQGSYITDPVTKLPLYGIGMVTDISPLKKDMSMIFSIDIKKNENGLFQYKNLLSEFYFPDLNDATLSKREREILHWLSDGLSSKCIAKKLFLSENTVVNHRKNMLRKTNTKNVAELVRYALGKGMI